MISSLSNPLVKQARALRQRKARAEQGLFTVEGIHHVGEAAEAGWDIDVIFYDPRTLLSEFALNLVSQLSAKVQEVSSPVMEALGGKDNPVGLVAVVHQKFSGLDSLLDLGSGAALVSPQDPGNVGAILRTLDAVGGGALFLLDGGVDPYHPTCVRASMGGLFWKSIVQATQGEFMEWVRKTNFQLIGSSAHSAVDYRTFKPSSPFILLLGSEQKGLSSEQIDLCDTSVSIPMRGRASSLNLAVAASILLYQLIQP